MNDIIREIDEELKAKRYKELAKKYGKYVVGVIMLIVAGFGGYGWQNNRADQIQASRAEDFSYLAANSDATGGDWLQFAEARDDSFSLVALRFAAAYYLRQEVKDHAVIAEIMRKLSQSSSADYKGFADISGQITALNDGETSLPALQNSADSPLSAFAVLAEAERFLKQGDKESAIALLEAQLETTDSAEQALFFELANALKSTNQ